MANSNAASSAQPVATAPPELDDTRDQLVVEFERRGFSVSEGIRVMLSVLAGFREHPGYERAVESVFNLFECAPSEARRKFSDEAFHEELHTVVERCRPPRQRMAKDAPVRTSVPALRPRYYGRHRREGGPAPIRRRGSRRSSTSRAGPSSSDDPGGEPPEHRVSSTPVGAPAPVSATQPELEQFSCAAGAHDGKTSCRVCGWNSVDGPLPWERR
jgi:hypothetical protein